MNNCKLQFGCSEVRKSKVILRICSGRGEARSPPAGVCAQAFILNIILFFFLLFSR